MAGASIDIEQVDHIGIRVSDPGRALAFYRMLGFELEREVEFDAVIIIRNAHGVEINLVVNANDDHGGRNVLMDIDGTKYAGITHLALRVASIAETVETLNRNGVEIRQGPVKFGDDGNVSVFVRDPDLNVIELRGRDEDLDRLGGVTQYTPG